MKDETKEILDIFTKYKDDWYSAEYKLKPKQCVILFDYITNLQEENERLKELCDKYEEEHNTAFKIWTMKMKEMPDYEEKMNYKSRNEKAIELINAWLEGLNNDDIIILLNDLGNILKGSDE